MLPTARHRPTHLRQRRRRRGCPPTCTTSVRWNACAGWPAQKKTTSRSGKGRGEQRACCRELNKGSCWESNEGGGGGRYAGAGEFSGLGCPRRGLSKEAVKMVDKPAWATGER
eukprot:6534038-Alexandrium_andersonii.AAC.1